MSPALLNHVEGALAAVMAYSNAFFIQRLKSKLGITEAQALALFEDMKRFLYLCGTHDRALGVLGPSPEIDKAWHEFILCTEDYAEFCICNFGKFIHHRPNRPDDPTGDGSVATRTLELARATFGDLTDNWRYPAKVHAGDGCCGEACSGTTNCQDPPCR